MPDITKSKSYHHGNLVEALVSATIGLIEERGLEQVSVREAAKRAGVSPGAPFRHFRSKAALMTAVAEQAMSRLVDEVNGCLENADVADPMDGVRAIGQGYLRWALANPTHFEIISSRSLIDFSSSEKLQRDNDQIRTVMIELLQKARDLGQVSKEINLDHIVLASRALVYGLARMVIDGHFPEWHVSEPPADAVQKALDLFIASVAASTGAQRGPMQGG